MHGTHKGISYIIAHILPESIEMNGCIYYRVLINIPTQLAHVYFICFFVTMFLLFEYFVILQDYFFLIPQKIVFTPCGKHHISRKM